MAVNKVVMKAHECEGCGVVERKVLSYLSRCPKSRSGIISFKHVFRTLSWLFHLDKDEAWQFLKELRELGLVEIVPYRGIRILRGGCDD
jgi:hypothetical protein